MIKAKYITFYSVPHTWSISKVKLLHIFFIGIEGFTSSISEGQSKSWLADFFNDSKSRECSHIFRNCYCWWLHLILLNSFIILFSLSVENCAVQLLLENVIGGRCGWLQCCQFEASALKDLDPKSFLQVYYNNPSYTPFRFHPVTVENSVLYQVNSTFPNPANACQASQGDKLGKDLELIWSSQPAKNYTLISHSARLTKQINAVVMWTFVWVSTPLQLVRT